MRLNQNIVELAVEKACSLLDYHLDEKFVYHDITHTVTVVDAANSLATKLKVSKQERMILTVAAWFHDTGYVHQIEDHEIQGAQLAEDFLKQYHVDNEVVQKVTSCILATKFPQQPKTLLEQIICDADMYHLSTTEFSTTSQKLREEWRMTKGELYNEKEWLLLNLKFISGHQYHSSYAQKHLEEHKQKNIKLLKQELNVLEKRNIEKGKKNSGMKKQKFDERRLERGVETLFRTASSNHMKLSGMADNKAHILLSINSIIISVILSVLTKKLSEATNLIIPTIILLCVAVTTIVFAVLATKPKVSKGIFTKEQIDRRQVNLLFFGNFHQMELELFEGGIQEIMYDKEYLYKTMMRDLYFLGKVLAVKYRYLHIGYRVFMYGLIVSVLAFAISFFQSYHG
jgi:predicted metal-dependent HD superfamily phosphohydrolase